MIDYNDAHNKLYKSVAVSFAAIIVGHLIIGLLIKDKLPSSIIRIFISAWFWYMLVACSIAFLFEFYIEHKERTIERLKSTSFKIISAISALPILVFTNINIDQFINDYTGLDPSLLPNAALALKMIFVPLSWLVILTLILFLLMMKERKNLDKYEQEPTLIDVLLSKNISNTDKKNEAFKHLKNFLRMIGIAGTILFSISVMDSVQQKNGVLNLVAKVLVLNTEYFKTSNCIELTEYEYAADIGRGFVSVYDVRSRVFNTKQCEIV